MFIYTVLQTDSVILMATYGLLEEVCTLLF